MVRNSISKGEAGLRLPGIKVWMEMTLQAEEVYKDCHKERVCWAVGRQGSQWGTSRERVVQEGWRGSRARSQGVESTHGNKSSGKTWRGDTGATESDSLVKDHSKSSHRTRNQPGVL